MARGEVGTCEPPYSRNPQLRVYHCAENPIRALPYADESGSRSGLIFEFGAFAATKRKHARANHNARASDRSIVAHSRSRNRTQSRSSVATSTAAAQTGLTVFVRSSRYTAHTDDDIVIVPFLPPSPRLIVVVFVAGAIVRSREFSTFPSGNPRQIFAHPTAKCESESETARRSFPVAEADLPSQLLRLTSLAPLPRGRAQEYRA